MSVYKNIYLNLFNAFTDAIREIESKNPDKARQILVDAQRDCEDTYITEKQ